MFKIRKLNIKDSEVTQTYIITMVPMIYESDTDSESDDVDVMITIFDINKSMCPKKRKLAQSLVCNMFLTDEAHTRNPKVVRDRDSAWAFVQTFSDDLFKRHFRVTRTTFNEIVSRMMFCFDSCSFL